MASVYQRWSERLLGLGGLSIGALDLFGLLGDSPTVQSAIPSLTLTLIGGLLLFSTGASASMERQQDDLAKSRATLDEQARRLAGIEAAAERQQADAAHLVTLLRKDALSRLDGVADMLRPDFRTVAAGKARSLVEDLHELVRRQTFEIASVEEFRAFYIDAFEAMEPGTTIHATSRTETNYFWIGTAVGDAIGAFIARGGTVKRVFYVDAARSADPALLAALDAHAALGVEVYTVDPDCLGGRRRLVLVDGAKRFGWDVTATDAGRIEHATVTAEPELIGQYRQVLTNIRSCPSLRPHRDHAGRF